MIVVTCLDGSTEMVTLEVAKTLRDNNKIIIPDDDGKALTIEDVFGEGYGD